MEKEDSLIQRYDVVIVGAGPAGLRCAEILGNAGKKVLLLEKNSEIGPKICAGGITRKCFRYLNLPDNLIEGKFQNTIWHSVYNKTSLEFGEDLLYTINRKNLGSWQLGKLNRRNVDVITGLEATKIGKNYIIVNENQKVRYQFLVGADGANSIVRKFLGLKTYFLGVAYQYLVPKKFKDLELFFDSKSFKSWYAWIFPYNNITSIGSGYFPKFISGSKSRENFERWLIKNKIEISSCQFEAHPINCDYQGFRFGNIFLCGEAAGLADGLTGEGIYGALVSGEDIANLIINPHYNCRLIRGLRREIYINHFILRIIHYTGPFRDYLYALVIFAVKNKNIARLLLRVLT